MNYRTDLQSLKKWLCLLFIMGIVGLSHVYGQGWKYTFGGNKIDDVNDVIQTSDNGFVLAGYSQSFGAGDNDLLVTRLDVDGTELWSKIYNEAFTERAYVVLEAEEGNLLLAGDVQLRQMDDSDAYLLKIDGSGNLIWKKNYGSSANDYIKAAVKTTDGGYLLAGTSRQAENQIDAFVIKVDAEGNEVWSKTYGSAGHEEEILSIAASPDGFALAGHAVDTLTLNRDFYVLKIDANGNELWSNRYGNNEFEEAKAIVSSTDGGYFVAGNRGQSYMFLIKLNESGDKVWSYAYGENLENFCNSLIQLPNGDLYMVGTTVPDGVLNAVTYLVKVDSEGRQVWTKTYGEGVRYEEGIKLIPTSDEGFAIACVKEEEEAQFTLLFDFQLIKTDAQGNIFSNSVEGHVFYDVNLNCEYDPGIDAPLDNWLVKVEGENNSFYGTTNADGQYSILADTGRYNISVLIQNDYWFPCWDDQNRTFTQFYDTISRVDFPMQARIACPIMEVNVAAAGLSVCEDVTYTIDYCNSGTIPAENAYVEIELDELLTFNTATLPVANQNGNFLRFDLGTVPNGACGSFQINTSLACEGYIVGEAHQVTAHIYPDTLCVTPSPDWDMASIRVEGKCDEEQNQVQFTIRNVGSGGMAQSLRYIVVQDDIMFLRKPFQLPEGERIDTAFEATGATYRLIAEQSPGHPGMSYPTVAIEGCAEEGGNPVISVGYVTLFSEDDRDPFISIDVQENIAGRPDNAMRGYPKGYDEEHYIDANTDLTYHIQFVNTGTDTITRLVVRDTLSPHLDMATVQPGASSSPYKFEAYGEGILKFTFEDLKLLPGESNGFVRFTVSQKPDLAKETVIENTAVLFYDYNKPLMTNKVFHTVGGELEEFVVVTGTKDVFVEGVEVTVEPNPFTESAFFNVKSPIDFKYYTLSLYDLSGRLIRQEKHSTNRFPIERATLAPGLYAYRLEGDGRLLNSGKIVVR